MSQPDSLPPLILTLRMDKNSQDYFNMLRKEYFPPERNYLDAHLTLFHHLQDDEQTIRAIKSIRNEIFDMQTSGLKFLGAGVAYSIESPDLRRIRSQIAEALQDQLIPQDKQGYRPHITIQNKVSVEEARTLFAALKAAFHPTTITTYGLDLWQYLGGPWRHHSYFPFST